MNATTRRAALKEIERAESHLAALRAEVEAGRKRDVPLIAECVRIAMTMASEFVARGATAKTYDDGSVGYFFERA